MIHHRAEAFEHHFFRRSCRISSDAIRGSMVLSLSLSLGEGNVGPENSAPNAFIRIDSAGKVVLTMPRLEMGRGTSVRLLIAEELEVAPSQVDLEYAPPEEAFGGNAMLQELSTGHSNFIRRILRLLGEASATARVMLIAAAARRWGVDVRLCHAYEGEVIHAATWRTLKYGELAVDAANMPIPREIALKEPRAERRSIAPALPAMLPDGLGLR
jgi:isoquinoline 1-oxidoreductase subunit beta